MRVSRSAVCPSVRRALRLVGDLDDAPRAVVRVADRRVVAVQAGVALSACTREGCELVSVRRARGSGVADSARDVRNPGEAAELVAPEAHDATAGGRSAARASPRRRTSGSARASRRAPREPGWVPAAHGCGGWTRPWQLHVRTIGVLPVLFHLLWRQAVMESCCGGRSRALPRAVDYGDRFPKD
jgi:hypothetical protein